MKNKLISIVTIIAVTTTAATVNAQGLFARFGSCPGGVCYRAKAAVYQPAPRAVEYIPAPCEAAGPAPCEAVTAAPAPCDPVATCEPCAPVAAEPAPEPCEPVAACAPGATCESCTTAESAVICEGGACPIRPIRAAAKTAVASVTAAAALVKINALRARYGLRALTLDNRLQTGAESSAAAQARAGRVFHAAGCGYEICAANAGEGVDIALNQWLASTAHRQILLGSQFTRVGVATVKTTDGRNYCAVRFN